MYPPNDRRLDQIAAAASQKVDHICQKFRVPQEVGKDLVKLALYDIILYIGKTFSSGYICVFVLIIPDNSGSIEFEEGGDRKNDLQLILSRVVYTSALFDSDGISVRFMNNPFPPTMDPGSRNMVPNPRTAMLDNVRSQQQVDDIMRQIPFKGLTPIGTQLREQVIEPLILQRVNDSRGPGLPKPVLIIIVTDGQPAGEDRNTLATVIRNTTNELSRNPRYGRGAISYQIAQVGKDLQAQEFLSQLDSDSAIGDLIDCTSSMSMFIPARFMLQY